jgi:hypothetical protein
MAGGQTMMRRVAIILGLAWTVLLGSIVVSPEVTEYVRRRAWPTWQEAKFLLLQALLYGTMAFLCFAVVAALGKKEDTSGSKDEPEDPNR